MDSAADDDCACLRIICSCLVDRNTDVVGTASYVLLVELARQMLLMQGRVYRRVHILVVTDQRVLDYGVFLAAQHADAACVFVELRGCRFSRMACHAVLDNRQLVAIVLSALR